ncbi:hypothetical protein [Actibacterium lipolyticum]|uniref:Uncharacterized protein n=1 Tax=Actibacterium lipolyticum TaxID=1524263 RepID=A0A238KU31_9RHOB|nr:hypothetical protein [Actibacterium lipolyticum]SMX46091.1 hypothetical protein COL8621_02966 [Actibacterium lipolyticum]
MQRLRSSGNRFRTGGQKQLFSPVKATCEFWPVAAVCGLLLLLSPNMGEIGLVWHHRAFLLLLLVFSTSTWGLYPVLFVFRLLPRVLSVWGLIGGLMPAVSVLLIFRGVDMSALPTKRFRGAE